MGKHKILIILLLGMMLLSCTNTKPRLRVGLNADYPPFEYKVNQVLTGIDVELAKKTGELLGCSVEFVEMEFDELIPALINKRIDLAISAITINKQRQQIIDFSIPYFCADQALIANENNHFKIDDLSDIASCRIGVQNGTTGQYFLQYNLVEKGMLSWENLTAYENNNQAISELINNQIDLLIMDDSAAKTFCKIKPVKIVHIIKTDEQYGIAMRKDFSLKTEINTALQQILNSDYWTVLITRYM